MSPAEEAACAAARLLNGEEDRPSGLPPPELFTYQTLFCTLIVTVAVLDSPCESLMVYVKLSVPLKFTAGRKLNVPLVDIVTLPPLALVPPYDCTVRVSMKSKSFWRTLPETLTAGWPLAVTPTSSNVLPMVV